MAPTLYMTYPSPPVRTVLITAKALGINLTLKELDLLKGEHKTPEYLKLNPQHTVPTLVDDDGFTISDSHAIAIYLVAKYGKNDALYPKDIKKQAIINQRLHFESGTVFAFGRQIIGKILFYDKNKLEESEIQSIDEIYGFLEAFLGDNSYVTGNSVTIADYSLFTGITSVTIVRPVNEQQFPKIAAWLKRMENLPEAEENKKGLAILTKFIQSKLSK